MGSFLFFVCGYFQDPTRCEPSFHSCIVNGIECFHVTSQRPCWCPWTKERRPCWCPQLILRELSSIIMQTFSFVSVEKQGCWSREWKHSIIKSQGCTLPSGKSTKLRQTFLNKMFPRLQFHISQNQLTKIELFHFNPPSMQKQPCELPKAVVYMKHEYIVSDAAALFYGWRVISYKFLKFTVKKYSPYKPHVVTNREPAWVTCVQPTVDNKGIKRWLKKRWIWKIPTKKEATHNGNEVRLFNWEFFWVNHLLKSHWSPCIFLDHVGFRPHWAWATSELSCPGISGVIRQIYHHVYVKR